MPTEMWECLPYQDTVLMCARFDDGNMDIELELFRNWPGPGAPTAL